ncbi:MAG: ABC transporter transmembrane domain-containing protein [Clostridiales bacterium]|nr:ABC transporter transmembrane domain-containing protein [Clostridiales bacterium]
MTLFRRMLHKRIGLVILTINISVLTIVASLWWNSQLSSIINSIDGSVFISNQTIVTVAATILICSGVTYVLSILSGWTCETLTHDLRMGYARNFTMLPITEIENINAGEHISKLQNEISDVSGYLCGNLFPIVDDCIRFVATFSWMLWLNPKLTILAHLPVVLIMWYTVYSSKVIGDAVQQSQHANVQMGGFIDTLVSVFPIIRIFNASPLICSKYGEVLKQWEASSIKEERTRARLMSFSALLSCIPLLLLFLIGGSLVINEKMTLGTLYIFINLSGNVSGVMMNIPGRLAAFRRFWVNMKRLQPSVLIAERG